MEGMTHEEAPYKFQWMNLDIEFYRSENDGEWMVRVFDADTAGSGTTALWVEQPLAMAVGTLGVIYNMGLMLMHADKEHGGESQSMGANPR